VNFDLEVRLQMQIEIKKNIIPEGYSKIFEDKSIWKKVTTKGEGDTPNKGAKIYVHFIGYYYNENINKTLFQSTTANGHEFVFTLGKEETIPGLEAAAVTFQEGEVSTVIITPELAFGAMGNPQGFHGNGIAIPGDVILQFDIVVLFIDYEISNIFDKSVDEKLSLAQFFKDRGNKYFSNEKLYQATKLYKKPGNGDHR